MWSRKSNLQGNPGDCPAKFVMFGRSVSVTNKILRGFSLFWFAFGFLTSLLVMVNQIKGTLNLGKYQTGGYVWDIISDSIISPDSRLKGFCGFFIFVGGLCGWIYVIITTETILLRNDLKAQTISWSFGQTVALILLLSPFLDFLLMIKIFVTERRERRPQFPSASQGMDPLTSSSN